MQVASSGVICSPVSVSKTLLGRASVLVKKTRNKRPQVGRDSRGTEDAAKFSHLSGSAFLSLEFTCPQPCSSGRKQTLSLHGFSKSCSRYEEACFLCSSFH